MSKNKKIKSHGKKIYDIISYRPVLKDEDGYVDIIADEEQIVRMINEYINKNILDLQ